MWLSGLRGQLVSIKILVPSLALFSGVRIWCCCKLWVADLVRIPRGCGCGVGQQLQLCFDPQLGNFHMPWVHMEKKNCEYVNTCVFINDVFHMDATYGPELYSFLLSKKTKSRVERLEAVIAEREQRWQAKLSSWFFKIKQEVFPSTSDSAARPYTSVSLL